MAKNITLYPVLTRLRSKDIFTISAPCIKYSRAGKVYPLTLNESDSSASSISDDQGYWNADEYNLIFEWEITYRNSGMLYDIEEGWEYACACHNAKIGLALSWYSSDSRRRHTIPFATLENDLDVSHTVKCIKHFDIAELRGEVGFSLVLYLQEEGTPNDGEEHFANTPGTLLGEIGNFTICLDGKGSFFTICEVNKPGDALWEVEYNIDDPSTDLFSECVSININRAHPKYLLVKRDSGIFCQQLLNEIMGNAIATVIETVRAYEKDDNFDCLLDFEDGSVAQALSYFRDILLWDFSSPITVSRSVRLFIDKNIKDYENTRV